MKFAYWTLFLLSLCYAGSASAQDQVTGDDLDRICRESGNGYYGGDIKIGACTALLNAFGVQDGLTNALKVSLLKARGEGFQRERASEEAIGDYTEVLRISPHDREALEGRALAAVELGRTDQAVRDATQLISDGDAFTGLNLRCWARSAGNSDLEQAELDCKAAQRIRPDRLEPHVSLGVLRLRQSRWAEAEAEFAASLTNVNFSQFGAAVARYHGGSTVADPTVREILREDWDLQRRFARFGLLPEWREPADWRSYDEALQRLTQAPPEEALTACEDPANLILQGAGCAALLRSGTLGTLRAYGDIAGRKSFALNQLRRLRSSDISVILRLNPEEPFSLTLRAQEPNDLSGALYYINHAIAAAPDWIYPRQVKARIYAAHDQSDSAIAVLTEAIAVRSDSPELYNARGDLWLEAEAYGRAILDYSAALRLSPDAPEYLNKRCWARGLGNRELELALADCDAAVAANPAAHIFDSRGLVKLRLGDLTGALADYEKAVVDGSPSSLYARGLVRVRLGDDAGRQDLEEALSKDPAADDILARAGLTPH